MKKTMTEERKSNWGKGIFVLYSGFVLLILSMVVYVSSHNYDLVASDYYERELAFQQQLDKIKRADALPTPLVWSYSRPGRHIAISFPVDSGVADLTGTIRLFRPSDASLDVSLPIDADSAGVCRLDVSRLASGLWKMQIDWTSGSVQYYREETVVIQ